MTNVNCVKSSMVPQAYKIVSTHPHEISGETILSRLIHSRAPHLGGTNGDVQSDLSTLAFNNGEQLEDFIAGFSESSKKLCSLDKLSPLTDFSSSI